MVFAQLSEMLADVVPVPIEKVQGLSNMTYYVAIGGFALAVVFVLLKIARGRKKKHPDLERNQREDLAEFPPPPPAGPRTLTVNGEPARLRLVVISPTGKAHDAITMDDVPELLDDVVKGLGSLVQHDKPRIKIWPTQLSVAGFAPTFHRLIDSPDDGKKSSCWVKMAGPARTGRRPILLGLAVLTEEPCKLGEASVETTEWAEILRVERA